MGSNDEVPLSAAMPSLLSPQWTSANIGPDSDAVLYTSAQINGVPFRLVATRVYFPEHFVFEEPVGIDHRFAEPLGEKLRIMWYDQHAWRDAAWTYLTLPEDDCESELTLPHQELDDTMKRHEKWFASSMELMCRADSYTEDDDDRVIPLVTPSGSYVVWGFPYDCALSASDENLGIRLKTAESSGSELMMLMSHPVCLEWCISGDELAGTEHHERAAEIICTVFSHPDCSLAAQQRQYPSHLLYVGPAIGFDIRRTLRVDPIAEPDEDVFVLESDDVVLAEKIIQKVATKQAFTDMSRSGERTYFLDIKLSNASPPYGTRLGLRVIASDELAGYNLSTASILLDEVKHRRAYLQIHPALLSLVEVLGTKRIMASIKHGRIIRREKGFRRKLDHSPTWARRLPAVTPSIKEAFREAYGRLRNWEIF